MENILLNVFSTLKLDCQEKHAQALDGKTILSVFRMLAWRLRTVASVFVRNSKATMPASSQSRAYQNETVVWPTFKPGQIIPLQTGLQNQQLYETKMFWLFAHLASLHQRRRWQ